MTNVPLLTKCSYCGRNMSSELDKCPHCGKMVPQIVRCRICKQEIGDRYSIDWHGISFIETSSGFFHLNCLEAASKCFCSVCNRKITFEEICKAKLASSPQKCPECGHISSIISCESCGGYLLSEDAVNRTASYFHMILKHTACHASDVAEGKRQHEERKRNKLCHHCGEKLDFISRLFRSETHDTCEERYMRGG